jgi:hypothetical protein
MKMTRNKSITLFALLVLLMAATRSHHFDSLTHLPDASLAAFLLAGIYLPLAAFPALLLVAGLADYFAINYAGVSDWCFSPAYWFLIPTYAVMWYAGRFYAARHSHSWGGLALFAATALLATSAAFVISSGSFYLFSGRFAEMTALQYAGSVAKYYGQYLSGALLYLSIAACVQAVADSLSGRSAHA